MEKDTASFRKTNDIWKFFTSLKLTVAVLLLLAATSIIGTLIPQNRSPADYLNTYGEFSYRVFSAFDFFDMYRSWWFQLLLFTLAVNIIVCSIDKLSATWKIIFNKNPNFSRNQFNNAPGSERFESDDAPEALRNRLEGYVSGKFGMWRVTEKEDGFLLFGERFRKARLGVYVVHASILLLLAGAMMGSVFGYKGFANIPEGETTDHLRLQDTRLAKDLGFTIRCNDFDVSFYDSGTPKEFRSSLTIIENGKEVLTRDIIVNKPLRYKGINIFQASYGQTSPKSAKLNFTVAETGKTFALEAKMGQALTLPDNLGTFKLIGHTGNYNFMGRDVGEALIANWAPVNGKAEEIAMLTRFPKFDRMRKGSFVVTAGKQATAYYTGLQITHDPGVWTVYAGFLLMIVGCYLSFFLPHEKYCIEVTKKKTGSKVLVLGTSNKGKLGMNVKVSNLSRKLENLQA